MKAVLAISATKAQARHYWQEKQQIKSTKIVEKMTTQSNIWLRASMSG